MDETRQLYIISGCNGAGKTTASYTVLPEILLCKEFVNADEIAKGLSPFNPESMAIEAGRLMLKRINELLAAKVSFSIETTLVPKIIVFIAGRVFLYSATTIVERRGIDCFSHQIISANH